MPELDAERRERLAAWFHERGSCRPWEDDARCDCADRADALAPLVAGWLADAWDEGYLMALRDVENIAADMNADNPYRDKPSKGGEDVES